MNTIASLLHFSYTCISMSLFLPQNNTQTNKTKQKTLTKQESPPHMKSDNFLPLLTNHMDQYIEYKFSKFRVKFISKVLLCNLIICLKVKSRSYFQVMNLSQSDCHAYDIIFVIKLMCMIKLPWSYIITFEGE